MIFTRKMELLSAGQFTKYNLLSEEFFAVLCIIVSTLIQAVLTCTPLLFQWTTSDLWCLFGGKRGDYQNCSVLYCVLKFCTVISTLRWAVLTVLWIGFCHTGPISLCIDSFVFVYFVYFMNKCYGSGSVNFLCEMLISWGNVWLTDGHWSSEWSVVI